MGNEAILQQSFNKQCVRLVIHKTTLDRDLKAKNKCPRGLGVVVSGGWLECRKIN